VSGRARVRILEGLLVERLMLPAGTVIRGAEFDPIDMSLVLVVEHHSLPDVPEGAMAPDATVVVREYAGSYHV
jgi:hypothetical protein